MKRILFVDDEAKLLEGLQRMLRPQRKEWDMIFVLGANEALDVMAKTPIDVVVTDMRMPGMDGAALLQCVHDNYPGVLRIVLSGHFDTHAGLRAVPVAHQFLTKPCNPEKLKAAIARGTGQNAYASDDATRRVISAIGVLPSPPRTCAMLLEALQNPNTSTETIARIVEQDVAISAKLLQLVNSAFFTLSHEVSDLRAALMFLGLDMLNQLAVSASILSGFSPARPVHGFSLEGLEQHSQITGRIAGILAAQAGLPHGAAMAGLLHDTGKLILATRLTQQFELAIQTSIEHNASLDECELKIFGTTHAEIGAHLLNLWGLPQPIVDAIAWHHRPVFGTSPVGQMDICAVVHIADALAEEHHIPPESLPAVPQGIDIEYLTQMELTGRLAQWRVLARGAVP